VFGNSTFGSTSMNINVCFLNSFSHSPNVWTSIFSFNSHLIFMMFYNYWIKTLRIFHSIVYFDRLCSTLFKILCRFCVGIVTDAWFRRMHKHVSFKHVFKITGIHAQILFVVVLSFQVVSFYFGVICKL
jgi:hypothetical protein